MRHIIPHVLAAAVLIAPAGAAAATIECKAELPTPRNGYWSWRIIDGKRCWYPGRPGIAKTQLQWRVPAAALAPSAPDEPAPVVSAPEPASGEATSALSHSEELSFEQRWRLR